MTDRDRLEALLSDFGVVFSGTDKWTRHDGSVYPEAVRIEPDAGPKNDGYSGFWCEFTFADDGTFLRVGVWE